MSQADARVETPQIVVNLGDRADSGAGIPPGRLLLDADGWRQAGQIIDVGLLQLTKKLARIAGQRLYVAALPLGIERIERQGAFAGAADARENDQLITRQIQIDAAELVLRRSADDNGAVAHN